MRKPNANSNSKKIIASLSAEKETEFNLGYLYRTFEERIDSFAAQAGGKITIADIADRLGHLLRVKAKNVRTLSGAAELLHEMRQDGASISGAAGDHFGSEARSSLHVRTRTGRTLSKEARNRIAAAQRLRWAKSKRTQRAKAGGKGKPMLPWSDTEDGTILAAIRTREKVAAPEVARELLKKLNGRTEGGIRQRIARLVKNGSLKASMSKKADGGIPHLMVEAAA